MAVTHSTHKMQFQTITFLFLRTFQKHTHKNLDRKAMFIL